jgi:carbamoyl-phosphate synthase large subunit
MGFKIITTRGTYEYFKRNSIESVEIRKLGYGRPDIVDGLKNREIQLIVNTPSGKRGAEDGSYIRKSAIKYKVPYITTTAAAIAAAKGIAARREGRPQVRSLQEYHAAIR